jgi:hypothetical protein
MVRTVVLATRRLRRLQLIYTPREGTSDWGWVFFYTSERYLKTGDFRYAVAGNAPYIVNRHTGEVRVTGTAYSIEHYIDEYERGLARR